MSSERSRSPHRHSAQRHTGGLNPQQDPIASAHTVGLRYVTDRMPGIRREQAGKGFRYRYATGETVKDEEVLGRIRSLAIPPAWTDVWICPDPAGHLQATGLDDRHRKQYRYHKLWREIREETKYSRMIAFGKALPGIRARVARDLGLKGLSRDKVLATVVRLLELSLIRVGNDEYEKENESFGLTTMKNRHVEVKGAEIHFHFKGKAGKSHRIDVKDPDLARIVRRCQDLPGQELFEYVDENGKVQDVKSTDVNEYLHTITQADFTAKDFRTWAGTMLAAAALQEESARFETKVQAKRNLVHAIESVAAKLGNTPSICKKCYVHPHVIDAYLDGSLGAVFALGKRGSGRSVTRLTPHEAAVISLLRRRLRGQDVGTALKLSLRRLQRKGPRAPRSMRLYSKPSRPQTSSSRP
ncbi:MAG TPA: DNA topoisomerase IB [Verrucomicrobiae bacterium]|nr:DNA topoisomerase IB [Verrucomicrobiae bacterium]